jgi:hypothetical protein
MVNKISSLFTSQISRLRPYLTPRASLISMVALGALATLVYFLRRKLSNLPIFYQHQPNIPPAAATPPPAPLSTSNSASILFSATSNAVPVPLETPAKLPSSSSVLLNVPPLSPQSVLPPVPLSLSNSNSAQILSSAPSNAVSIPLETPAELPSSSSVLLNVPPLSPQSVLPPASLTSSNSNSAQSLSSAPSNAAPPLEAPAELPSSSVVSLNVPPLSPQSALPPAPSSPSNSNSAQILSLVPSNAVSIPLETPAELPSSSAVSLNASPLSLSPQSVLPPASLTSSNSNSAQILSSATSNAVPPLETPAELPSSSSAVSLNAPPLPSSPRSILPPASLTSSNSDSTQILSLAPSNAVPPLETPAELPSSSSVSLNVPVPPRPRSNLSPSSSSELQPPDLENFKVNAQAIINFPEDGSAQIKSFHGRLGRGDGFLRYYNRQVGTQLHETILVITQTFVAAYSIFEETYLQVKQQTTREEQIKHLRPLCDALIQEMNLLEGLGHIQQVYNERYQDIPSKEGLTGLNALYEFRKLSIEEHSQHYQQLIQFLKEASGDVDPLTDSLIFPQTNSNVTTAEAAKSLSPYCQMYCPGISSNKAFELIRKGQILMREILNNDREASDDAKQAENELLQITWFLKYCALKKNQGAHEWSLAIEEDKKLYAFLMSAPGIYERASSHYVGRSKPSTGYSTWVTKSSSHYGVDIENELMPANKRTILFGLVDATPDGQKILFFKPENFGTQGPWDLLSHAIEFGESVGKKARAQGEDDLPGMQKERVPDNTKKAFTALLTHIQDNLDTYEPFLSKIDPNKEIDLKKAMDLAKLWGIAYMYRFITVIGSSEGCPREFNKFSIAVKETLQSLDHLDKRTGKEIYLTKQDLDRFIS